MPTWTTSLPADVPARRAAPSADSLIDLDAAGGIDLDRLERSLALVAEPSGRGRWRVRGGAQDHWVDLHDATHPRCDCGDHLWREAVCKHIYAALLREGDARVVAAVGQVLTRMREKLAAARAAAGAAQPAKRAA